MSAAAPAPRAINAHIWARHPDDWYVEPEWVSERLFEDVRFDGRLIHDPACGSGRIVRSARAAGFEAVGSDIVRRSPDCAVEQDFLIGSMFAADAIVSNPPYRISKEFAEAALARCGVVALLLPTIWIHGDARSRWLSQTPLAQVLIITPRPSMPPGPVIEAGIAPGGGKADFAWFIWRAEHVGKPSIEWLRKLK